MSARQCLVTGGCGFIGSHLVAALLARGHRVRVLDNLATGSRENLAGLAADVELLVGDLTDPECVRRAVQGCEVVFHQAALASVARSVEAPLPTHAANATGTLALLHAARAAGVRRVIYAGSSSAYGDSAVLPKHEDLPPQPLSPYAAAKLAGEHYCAAFARSYGLETLTLRYFNVFGPRQDPASEYAAVVPRFITAMLRGQAPVIYGDGRQTRDFTYVDNVVEANLLAMEAPRADGAVFNVACGTRYSLLDLVDRLNAILGTTLAPRHAPARPGDVRHSQASIARAQEQLGYRVRVSFEEGLARTVAWYRERLALAG
ncbi:MAG TPA: SDR family oxidoreductase [Chloroflexota bacterium]|nr:SDR family oxidoreductase [Chloroflexota bacterium]